MEDDRDADDAIRGLDRIEFGRKGRRLRVEWTKERGGRRPESSRKSSVNSRPSKTLFVINFDPYHTRTRDLEKHFDPYGKILNIRIRRNFAFVQYESQEDATRALDATNMSKLMDRVVSVEYAIKDDDDRRNGYSPDRTHDRSRSPIRSHDRRRSPSPYRRERASPDYGRGPTLSFNRSEKPFEYDRGRSPSPTKERPSPPNARVTSPKERDSPEYGQEASLSPQRERLSPDGYRHGASPNSKFEVGDSPRNGAESPMQERYSHSLPLRERSQSFDE